MIKKTFALLLGIAMLTPRHLSAQPTDTLIYHSIHTDKDGHIIP